MRERLKSALLRLRRLPAAVGLRTPGLVELAGLAAIVVGVYQVNEPAAWIVAGLGAAFWAQGARGGNR